MHPIARAAAAALLVSTAAQTLAAPRAAPRGVQRVVAFGDSYADIGNARAILVDRGLGALYDSRNYPTGRFSGGTNFVDTIAATYGVGQDNYAVGGAGAGANNVAANGLLPGFRQQWQAFAGGGTVYVSGTRTTIPVGGRPFASGDLGVFSIGGNDARAYARATGSSVAAAPTAAATVAANATQGLDALVARGLRRLVWTGGDTGLLPESIGLPRAAVGTAFSTAYNRQMQGVLGGYARGGVQVAYIDITTIGQAIQARPGLYGISNTTQACPTACLTDPALAGRYLFWTDGLHLTSAGFAVVGRYAVNQLSAPYAFRMTGDVPRLAAEQFGGQVGGRLDLARSVERRGLSVFGNFAAAHRTGRVTDTANGYDYNARGGIGGVEYGAGKATLGAIFGYARTRANGVDQDRVRGRSYQAAGYASVALDRFFAQGYGGYGWHDLDVTRTGVVDPLTASPRARSVVAGARTGWLVPLGFLRVGPTVALDYATARVRGYVEQGDATASLTLHRQRSEALLGSAGLEARAVYGRFSGWLRGSAERDFAGDGRTVFYAPTVAPGIVNGFAIGDTRRRAYGVAAGGLDATLFGPVSLQFTGRATIDRPSGNEAAGFVGLAFGF